MGNAAQNCSLCNLFGLDKGNGSHFPSMDEAKSHARVHFGQIQTFEDGDIDEEQMFERCFPKSARKMETDQGVPDKGRQALGNFILSLLKKRQKSSCIDCNLCGNNIGIVHKKGKILRFDSIITHACVHAGVKPFECRYCEKSFRCRDNVRAHLQRVHGTKMANQDFEDQSERFHDEILNSIKRCFTETKDEAPSEEMKDKSREYNAARCGRMTNASELAVQRQSFFNCTIKKYMDSDGKIKCRSCLKQIKARKSVKLNRCLITLGAVHHAQIHLSKPLYRCGVCKEPYNTYENMRDHLRTKHTLGMDKNHECFADKFHADLLAMFAQCYETDGSTD